jgi:hypothetical protein
MNREMDMSDDTPNEIDRRSLIKKSAVAGAIAWTSPMILSSKAGATSSTTCPPRPACPPTGQRYVVRFSSTSCAGDIPNNSGFSGCPELAGPVVSGCHLVQVVSFQANPPKLKLRLAPGVSVAKFIVKQGSGCSAGDQRPNCFSYTGKCGTHNGFVYGDEVIIDLTSGGCYLSAISNFIVVLCKA